MVGCALARLSHSMAHVKSCGAAPLGAKIWSSKKVDLVGIIAL